ncbi:hypothetical protein AN639_07540 [Candidatus Epulonipiscium fishelsonii]|uniref:Uncharacterized protein n=1 Tax=Candidatus Epulonipiscium fishelsonii TaxID=77094 RepID=A0ACC8XF98_9FIRM|nr:hypothetical protein AN639_07540 [Epulopiscium sp. SCG-B05WGA-EpuloA1]ONI41887.1 hypothetical protein AN396_02830 [Epulopiscium sp. SCG-B11WGA-EpuloA1]
MKIKTNLWTGIIMGLFSAILLIVLPEQVPLPMFNSGAPSPRILPSFAIIGMLIGSIALIIQSLVFKKEKIYEFNIKFELPAIIIIALLCIFVVLTLNIGFILASCIIFPIMLFYVGERKPFIYIFTILAAIAIFYLFKSVLNISLPGFGG